LVLDFSDGTLGSPVPFGGEVTDSFEEGVVLGGLGSGFGIVIKVHVREFFLGQVHELGETHSESGFGVGVVGIDGLEVLAKDVESVVLFDFVFINDTIAVLPGIEEGELLFEGSGLLKGVQLAAASVENEESDSQSGADGEGGEVEGLGVVGLLVVGQQ